MQRRIRDDRCSPIRISRRCRSRSRGRICKHREKPVPRRNGTGRRALRRDTLPFEDGSFSFLASGHIIEHTSSPMHYLREQLRVLQAGGFLFLEFPSRYHSIELHTGTSSVEWLPAPLRSWALRWRMSRFGGRPAAERPLDRDILTTLKLISTLPVHLL